MRTKFWYGVSVLASLVAGAGVASAADLAVKAPVYKAPPVFVSDWAGFYLGINGGYGWGDSSFPAFVDDVPANVSIKPKGGLFGGHAGYNWQYGSVVAGLEVDFDGADIKGANNSLLPAPSLKTDELASARARLGYTVLPTLLAYGTAGAGWGHSTFNAGFAGANDQGLNQFGWVAGAGLEYKLWGNFLARAEYLHYDFEKVSVPDATIKESIDVVRGGLSYKF
jgi:outer membrane immunogenic protein